MRVRALKARWVVVALSAAALVVASVLVPAVMFLWPRWGYIEEPLRRPDQLSAPVQNAPARLTTR